jgi:hypothetical protein
MAYSKCDHLDALVESIAGHDIPLAANPYKV